MSDVTLPANGPEYLSLIKSANDPMIRYPIMLMDREWAAIHGWHMAAVDLTLRLEDNQATWGRDGGLWIQREPEGRIIHFRVPEGDREAVSYVADLFHMTEEMSYVGPKAALRDSETFWNLRNALEERFKTYETVSCLHHRGVGNWRAGLSDMAPRATAANVARILEELRSDECLDREVLRRQAEESYPFLALFDERSRDTLTRTIDARERLQRVLNNVLGIRSGVLDRIRRQPAFTGGLRIAPVLLEGLESDLLRDTPEVHDLVGAALYAGIPPALLMTRGFMVPKRDLARLFVELDFLQEEMGISDRAMGLTDHLLAAVRSGAAEPLAKLVQDRQFRLQSRDESNRIHLAGMRAIPGELPAFELSEFRALAANYGAEIRQIRTGPGYADICGRMHSADNRPDVLTFGLRAAGEENDQYLLSVGESREVQEIHIRHAGKVSSLDRVARFRCLMLMRERARDPEWLEDHLERCAENPTAIAYRAVSNRWAADIRNIGWGGSVVDVLRG
ncbi:hypothetical protein [Paracoccus sp. ME4]|uniref:hypothetical protein n=1 Tax=Paracoccus sp. ME4 TaxID=3138066 RepID=UPI00398AA51D